MDQTEKPSAWLWRKGDRYEIIVRNGPVSRWEVFATFEELLAWMQLNPGVLMTEEETKASCVQMSFGENL